jgi:hypothetical protein
LYIEVFQGSDKPASIKKITDERGKVTPMIDTNALSLINELVKFKNELINDRGQLSYVLKSHKKPGRSACDANLSNHSLFARPVL